MSSVTTQPTNNSPQSTVQNELVNFLSFDGFIEEYLDKAQQYSSRMIRRIDYPNIVMGLREWLIRNVGCFTTIGYFNTPNINYWFDNQTLIEDFDDLLLEFRNYLRVVKAIDTTEKYTLTRFMDNVSFLLNEGEVSEDNVFAIAEFSNPDIDSVKRTFAEFESDLERRYGDVFDINGLLAELKGENFEGLLQRHLLNPLLG